DIGGMPVERRPGPVIAHRGPGISVRGSFLHIPQRYPGIERRGDERMPQRVRPDGLSDPGAASYPAYDPGGAVPVQPAAIKGEEDRSFTALADGQVYGPCRARCERDGDNLAALAGDDEGPVPPLDAQGLARTRSCPAAHSCGPSPRRRGGWSSGSQLPATPPSPAHPSRSPPRRVWPATPATARRRRTRRATSTSGTAGSGDIPRGTPPTPPAVRARSGRGNSRCSPLLRRRGC